MREGFIKRCVYSIVKNANAFRLNWVKCTVQTLPITENMEQNMYDYNYSHGRSFKDKPLSQPGLNFSQSTPRLTQDWCGCLTQSSFMAFFRALLHGPGRSVEISINFHSREKIVFSVEPLG